MGELRFDPDALSDIPKHEAERLLEKIQWIWVNRRVIDHLLLRHDLSGLCKRRKGKYRIVYSYDENPDEMVIRLAGTRDTIYKDAIKKFS
jgi:mRNA-degrading endonuclease RelE of RelBE toxin-antitoxin system